MFASSNKKQTVNFLTISDQADAVVVPGFKELLFEVNLGDELSGGSIDQITQGASIWNLVVLDLSNGCAERLGTPLGVAEGSVLLFRRQLNNNSPGDTVSRHGDDGPLISLTTTKSEEKEQLDLDPHIPEDCPLSRKSPIAATRFRLSYRMGFAISNYNRKMGKIILENIVDLGVLRGGGANHAGVSDVQGLCIDLGQLLLLQKTLVHALTDCTVSAIGADKDISLVHTFI